MTLEMASWDEVPAIRWPLQLMSRFSDSASQRTNSTN
jgi:hypothetical protein